MKGKLKVLKSLPIDGERIYSSKYTSDLFNKNINIEIWKSILSAYIVEHKTL